MVQIDIPTGTTAAQRAQIKAELEATKARVEDVEIGFKVTGTPEQIGAIKLVADSHNLKRYDITRVPRPA